MGADLFGVKKAAKQQAATAAAAAAETKQREAQREADIGAGKTAIDQAFSQFNPNFFSDYTKKYSDFYAPQVDDQYKMAQDKLKAQLAGQGVLESGVGNDAMARLAGTRATALSNIQSQGQDAANTLQRNIDAAKTGLYSANANAADPQSAAALATGTATSLAAPQNYSPLADLFAGALNSYGAYRTASNGMGTGTAGGALYGGQGPGYNPYTPSSGGSGGSSYSVIG